MACAKVVSDICPFIYKGCASKFAQKPLEKEDLTVIKDFELLFISNLVYLNGLLVLKLVRGTDALISETFRELKKFQLRKRISILGKGLKRKRKPKKLFPLVAFKLIK